ncbi:TPA: surface layer protein B [Methanosarcina acetivorans]|nr:lectin like domain-containing protein [Methanosarcina acetivorans]HIH93150.1 surface layer protein B [Methanosarcina acetivorans]
MKNKINTKNRVNMKKKTFVFSGLLLLFMIMGSSISMAVAGSSGKTRATEPVLSPENPDFTEYHADKVYTQSLASSNRHKKGFVPAPVDLSDLSKISTLEISAPAYYDLRTLNRVTSVKYQGESGACWTFATSGSLESYLMPEENRDFSENNMKNLLSSAYPEGFDRDPNDGGNSLMSTAYLAHWSGPVEETADPYSIYSRVSPENLPVQKHVQDVLFIPNRESSLDNTMIKSAILQYGALSTSMYFDDSSYYSSRYGYYYNGSSISNHAVSIVGWDDNYDKNNFSGVPPGNGAFIVKNSWGTYWGDNGYFYVSYYDSNIGNDNAVFTAENTDNYENIYQYDPLGWVLNVGYNNPTAWCANIFAAKSDETLESVSFYTTDSNCAYEIYIYTSPESGPLSREGPVLSKSGTIPVAGYHTVPLDSEIQLEADQKFSVVLKLTTPDSRYPIAIEMPYADWSSKATANPGESFISGDGSTWKDITAYYLNTNVCIKAFTDSGTLSVFPGYINPPTDLDQDGLYEDVNGNGILDFDDVVAYYDNMGWIEENALVAFFDFSNNGLIDFDDVVKLYDRL